MTQAGFLSRNEAKQIKEMAALFDKTITCCHDGCVWGDMDDSEFVDSFRWSTADPCLPFSHSLTSLCPVSVPSINLVQEWIPIFSNGDHLNVAHTWQQAEKPTNGGNESILHGHPNISLGLHGLQLLQLFVRNRDWLFAQNGQVLKAGPLQELRRVQVVGRRDNEQVNLGGML